MAIHINKPYKINPVRQKRYAAHYEIPADQVLVVPVKHLGDEVSCDIRWENDNGELKVIHNAVFIAENLIPVNAMIDDKLFELWKHYYGALNEK